MNVTNSRRIHPEVIEAAAIVGLVFLVVLIEGLAAPVFPQLLKRFDVSPMMAAWMSTGPLLIGACTGPLLGRLGDLLDRSWVVLSTVALVSLGCLMCFFAPSFAFILAGSALMGVTLAMQPLAVGLLAEILPVERQAAGNGWVIGAAVGGVTLGLSGSGFVVAHLSVMSVYVVALPLLALCALVVVIAKSRTAKVNASRAKGEIDWWGAVLLGATLTCLMLSISDGGTLGWTSTWCLAEFVGACVFGTIWFELERRHRSPLLDLDLFRLPSVVLNLILNAGLAGATIMAGMLVPLIIQSDALHGGGLGLEVSSTGYLMLPFGMAALVSAPLNSPLRKSIGSKAVLLVAGVLAAGSALALVVWPPSIWLVAGSLTATGVAIGLGTTESMNLVVAVVGVERAGSTSAIMYVIKAVAASACAQLCGAALTRHEDAATHGFTSQGFTAALLVCAATALLVIISAIFLRNSSGVIAKRAPALERA